MNVAIISPSTGDKYDQFARRRGGNQRICPASHDALQIDANTIIPSFTAGASALNLPTYRLGHELRTQEITESLIGQTAQKITIKLHHANTVLTPPLRAHHGTHAVLLSTHGVDTNPYDSESLEENDFTISHYHTSYLQALEEAGYNGQYCVHFETIPSLLEAKCIIEAMSKYGWEYTISFTLNEDGKLIDKTSITEAIGNLETFCKERKLQPPIGYLSNCFAPKISTKLLKHTPKWLGSYANTVNDTTGLDSVNGAKRCEPDIGASHIDSMIQSSSGEQTIGDGVTHIVGACCGNDLRLIAAIRNTLPALIGQD